MPAPIWDGHTRDCKRGRARARVRRRPVHGVAPFHPPGSRVEWLSARNSAQVHNCWRANCLRSPRDVEIVRTCESDQPTDRVITLPQSALFSPRGLNRRLLRRATIKKALKPVLHLKAVLLALVTTIAAVALRYHPRHVLRADRTRMVYVRKPNKETCP